MIKELFDKNMRALRSLRAELYELVSTCTTDSPVIKWTSGVSVGSEEIASRQVLYAVKEGRLYQLDSMYSSDELLDIWESTSTAVPGSKYIMFGLGNGMYARRILRRLYDNGVLLIYEPDIRLLRYVAEKFDISDVLGDKRVRLLLPQCEDMVGESDLYNATAECLEYTDLDSLQMLSYMNYERLYPEGYEYFCEKTTEVLAGMVANRHVMGRFGQAFVKNSLGNVPELLKSRSIASLRGRAEDAAAVIVSSGPSLNKNIGELKRAKGRAIIAAADSAVSVLLEAGIKPDIFFCVDAKKNKGHFASPLIRDIPLGCDIETTRNAFENHEGLSFFGRGRNPHINDFLDAHGIEQIKLKTGGSVAHAAMSFMLEIGIKTIILVGQDLAYTDDKSHANGSLRSTWDIDLSKNECYIEGMGGGEVRSTHEFVTYRNWFEREIEKRGDITVVNATEGGAKIHGARECTLSDAIDECCRGDFDAGALFEGASMLMTDEQQAELVAYMGELKKEIDALSGEIKKGLSVYDEMYKLIWDNKYSNPRFKKLYARTQEISSLLENSSAMYYVECMVQKEMTELMDRQPPGTSDERSQLIDAIDSGREYFNIVNKGIERIKEVNI